MSFIKDLTDKKESPGLPEPYPKYPTMAEVGITPRVELSDCQRCFGNDTHQQRLRGSLGQPVDVREIYQSAESRSCKGCSLFQQLILRAQEYMASPIKRIRFEISPGIGYHSRMLLIQENGETHEMGFGFDSLRSLCSAWTVLGVWTPRRYEFFSTLAQGWVDQCLSTHTHCRRPVPAPLPRRVVDVGHREAFLYESRGETGRYATLSHCWQDSQPLKTMRSTLKDRLGRLIWSQLPIAFQECIEIVRSLGIRYVWIDSLCILQDDSKEWEVEAARMASIFENSYLTITMHQSQPNTSCLRNPDSHAGSLSISGPTNNYPDQIQLKVGFRIRKVSQGALYNIESDRLSTRGWCFQERLLSNRILHCTPTELLFECSESRLCECSKAHEIPDQEAHFSSKNWKAVFAKDSVTNAEWQEMITMYTLKYLTYHKDTLPALSGIANRLRNGGQYYAGMWEDNMAQSLLWYTTVKEGRWPARPDSYVAPSFAWPSVIGPKAFLNCSTLEPKFKIISVSCSPRGDNPLGELIEGSILLNAAILEAVFVNGFDDPIRGNIFCVSDERGELCQYATLKCEGTGHFIFHPDGGEDRNMVAGTQLWCLRLFAGNTPEQYSCGLVLRRARFDETSFSHLTRYRRVGIFASIRNRHFIDSKSGNFKVI